MKPTKAFWDNEFRQLLAILTPRISQMAVTGAKTGAKKAKNAGIAWANFADGGYNQAAEVWAKENTDAILKGFMDPEGAGTFQAGAGQVIGDWIAKPGATVGDLNQQLAGLFGKARASTIAVTEATRAFSSGEEIAYKKDGIEEWTWVTSHDELTCEFCGAINGKTVKIGETFGIFHGKEVTKPPFHPNCRCHVRPKVKIKSATATPEIGVMSPVAGMPEAASEASSFDVLDSIQELTPEPEPAKTILDIPALPHVNLKSVDLHASEPTWDLPKDGKKVRYGGVIMDDEGRVLLRKPTGNYDGYAWTFPKGGGAPSEHPVDIATREVAQETGHMGQVVGIIPGSFESGTSRNYYFLMRSSDYDKSKMDTETEDTVWATPDEAKELIGQTTNKAGKERDLNILDSALYESKALLSGDKSAADIFGADMVPFKTTPVSPIPTSAPAKKPATKKPAAKKTVVPPSVPVPAQPPAPIVPAFQVPAPNITLNLPAPKGFPKSPDALKIVKSLGGSTGAKLATDGSGTQYVVKTGASADHVKEEAQADALYQALGVNVPKFAVYETSGGPVKVSEYMPNARTLGQVLASGKPAEIKKVRAALQKTFAVDALLGNWDVAGLGNDNILVDDKGKVWHVDNGGSLRFRAQGDRKTAVEFDEFPTEIWSLRGKTDARNPQTAAVFGDMEYREIVEQMREIVGKRETITESASPDLKEALTRRLDNMQALVKGSDALQTASWQGAYQDRIGYQSIGLRKQGISQKLPESLAAQKLPVQPKDIRKPHYSVEMKDQNGKLFDSLRGQNSTYGDFFNYMRNTGGNVELLNEWMGQQAGDSWNNLPQAYKYYVATTGKNKTDEYYWKNGVQNAKEKYTQVVNKYGVETFQKTFEAYHAFTLEMLMHTDMPNIDRKEGTITVWRTECNEAMNGASVGQKDCEGLRGAAESMSLLNPVYIHNDNLTRQKIYLADILGTYLTERAPGSYGPAFYGDRENEFVAILGRTKFDYLAKGEPSAY
jgi:SPP1 gp7 family putative phage head morphogenesis protein